MRSKTNIDRLIINSPYKEPKEYWHYDRTSRLFNLAEGRQPASYIIASENSKTYELSGIVQYGNASRSINPLAIGQSSLEIHLERAILKASTLQV